MDKALFQFIDDAVPATRVGYFVRGMLYPLAIVGLAVAMVLGFALIMTIGVWVATGVFEFNTSLLPLFTPDQTERVLSVLAGFALFCGGVNAWLHKGKQE